MPRSFLVEYIKDFRHVGAIAPSSRFLAQKMISGINFDTARVIVEYGAGTGSFTAEIIKHKQPQTTLIVFETNRSFFEALQKRFVDESNIIILDRTAEDIRSVLKEYSLPAPDYVVSGLPFASLPGITSKIILDETVNLLGKKGSFITFQYTLMKRQFFASYFKDIRIEREWRNIPPAYIVRCKN